MPRESAASVTPMAGPHARPDLWSMRCFEHCHAARMPVIPVPALKGFYMDILLGLLLVVFVALFGASEGWW